MHIEVNGIKVFFDVYGSKLKKEQYSIKEKPTIICLHPGPGLVDHTICTSFFARFSDIAQVIFIDQRGNGRSEQGDFNGLNLKQWGHDIFDFCQKLSIENPIVVGISWGGHTALSYVTQHPEHPSKIILCDTEATFNKERVLRAFEKKGGKKAVDVVKKFYEKDSTEQAWKDYKKVCVPLYAHNPYSSEELSLCVQHPEVYGFYKNNEFFKFNLIPKLQKIKCQILIFAADDGPVHPLESAEEIAAALPEQLVQFELIKKSGSPVYRDQPKKVEKIIRKFIIT